MLNVLTAYKQVKKIKTHSSKPALKYWSDNLASMSSSGQIDGIDDSNGLGENGGKALESILLGIRNYLFCIKEQ